MAESRGTIPAAARRVASAWIAGLSRTALALLLLIFLLFIHLVGLATFTHGFLLTRLTIPSTSPAYNVTNPAPVTATHSKAVVIIIDALRTDFISPFPPNPPSPFHHNVLTLPAEMTAAHPDRSMIFDSFSDPPTTTMQRIKGITTGSLPTFIDAGANFASTAIEEDNLISQAVADNRSVVFMGDDTWLNLFPSSFSQAYPYDSFNVEDLHTVDNGVIEHLFPHLEKGGWDVLIGHFLGVDHVGHRVGPDRDTMRDKLAQMDAVLRRVVAELDDDTLLVVLGDHGMNPKGDHGGDSPLETSAALWMYSKSTPINHAAGSSAYAEEEGLRQINQIDLVPTLALMLGLPIPFNNLGNIIPEVFVDAPETFAAAARAVTNQIERYINAYGNAAVLKAFTDSRNEYAEALESGVPILAADADMNTNTRVLEALRELWAQFSVPHIVLGVVLLALGVAATVALYLGVRNGGPRWDQYVRMALDTAVSVGTGVGSVAGTFAGVYTRDPLQGLQVFLSVAVGTASAVLAAPLLVRGTWSASLTGTLQQAIGPIILILHTLSFASNSFVMWEDRMVVFFLVSLALFHVLRALIAPQASLRLRILGFGILLAVLARTLGLSTVCREEQQPYCTVTFYEANGSPKWSVYGLIPFMLMIFPRIIGAVLGWSKSYSGPAPVFVSFIWRAVILMGAIYWTFEWMETWDGLNPDRIPLVKSVKLWVARFAMSAIFGLMPYIWASSGLCLDIEREKDQTGEREDEVTVLGFGNAFGSTYFLFVLMGFALVQLVSTPLAQLVLGGTIVAVVAHLELTDSQRDAVLLHSGFSGEPGAFEGPRDALVRPSFTDAVPLALLALIAFFSTGHQAVLATIQWKSAFVGFETVTYPWSPLLVILNTWGPIAFIALCVPLLATWNVSPRPNASVPILAHTVQMALAFITYFAAITLASAVTAAWLRRHLMVWKVFAPRFMLAGVTLVVVDLALIVAVGFGLRVTSWKVWRTFKSLSV
ncbi:uncharacterized protein CcaverHIS019_0303200 [Cutaneotrichosporon cavernicola]|uniref:GPI ethanolamine phosphate transferase 2 C-terminal domain-containing protein n=1 Tax=Cutaneotrichosporon cavernicola TaxID=279322 RepID=A0AA48I9E2_9TREE|nr:uncharacterized protein CcaverHIS019_0303200 [Cutaneotrichosporon cavernicola]BEI90250.1 hypothetical protein CcaverHIS019_0303200 [Cutaneotrichosporon cavernicola]BEI98027.1 hypothetical protein CcaverHIS631_0303260 [Cutaneotrichosporon cavernicola]BEJ05804.1 hypothetical protein CcaverHIS641_0303260 [Cutaneotrichosporon cavernicola]